MPTLRILEQNRKIKVGKKQSRGDKIKELRRVIFLKKFSIFHHLNHSAQYSYFKLQNIAWASRPDHPRSYTAGSDFGKTHDLTIPPQRALYPRRGYPAVFHSGSSLFPLGWAYDGLRFTAAWARSHDLVVYNPALYHSATRTRWMHFLKVYLTDRIP